MKRIMKWLGTGILCLAVLFAFNAATDTTAYAASTKTVYTQAQLTKALKNKSITTIKVSTTKTVTLTIPKANYSKKTVYVTAKNARIINKGKLKKLVIKSARQVVQQGTVTSLKVSSKKTGIVLKSGSSTKTINGNTVKKVNSDNPLRIFERYSGDYPASCEFHGHGKYAYLSSGDNIHGWYYNEETNTEFECTFIVSGDNVKTKKIRNGNNRNYLGETEFEIVEATSTYVKMKCISDTYGDKGNVYTYYSTVGNMGDPIDKSNPFVIFSSGMSVDGLGLQIHGSGKYSTYSYGNNIHGWYDNTKTKSRYECLYVVRGNKVTAVKMNNPGNTLNYLGAAQFEIISYDNKSVTMKSVNNVYGDQGTVYTFTVGEDNSQNNTGGINNSQTERLPVNPDNPLIIFSGETSCNNLRLIVHGSGEYSNMSYGDSIHGWYYNNATGTEYECHFIVSGTHITAKTMNAVSENYLGDAEFEIISNDSTSVTMKSVNNVYGDEGTVYVFNIS